MKRLSTKIEILNTNNRKCLIQKQKIKLRDGTVEINKCESGSLVIEKSKLRSGKV